MAASDGSISPPAHNPAAGATATVESHDRDKLRQRPTSVAPFIVTASERAALEGWTAVVLAAGRGTRMRSRRPKALHAVAGRPMLLVILDNLATAGFRHRIVVATAADDDVALAVAGHASVAVQREPLGTGHAALAARAAVGEAPRVLVVNADLPLLTTNTYAALAAAHIEAEAALTILSAELDKPSGYGRVLRASGSIAGIVEESEADAETRAVREVNVGAYAADTRWLWPALGRLEPSPHGEIYLPDAVRAGLESGERVHAHRLADADEAQQINTRAELALADRALRDRVSKELMAQGVTLIDPASTYIDLGVAVGEDTTLLPGTHLLGATVVGRECELGPAALLRNMHIGDHCTIGGSTLEDSTLADSVSIGPYCHVRPDSVIEAEAHIGNYAELKASRIGARTKVGHFSYLGDANIGTDVNIGAGTITANYDGRRHHRITIGDGAFIGSNSMLVAPITIGARARTGVGSVVTKDVPAGSTAIGAPARIRQSSATAGREGE